MNRLDDCFKRDKVPYQRTINIHEEHIEGMLHFATEKAKRMVTNLTSEKRNEHPFLHQLA